MSMKEGYLVIGILLSFPLAFLHRFLSPHIGPTFKDTLAALSGTFLTLLCFGPLGTAHLACLLLCPYLLTSLVRITPTSCGAIFAGSLLHLLYGYVTLSGVSYTVTWTLVYCQALLKVVSYYADLLEGGQDRPGPALPYLAYILFPTTLLVGPHFHFHRYVELREAHHPPTGTLSASAGKFLLGIGYIAGFYLLKFALIPDDMLLSAWFNDLSLPSKLLFLTFWSKWLISKYLGVWAIAESASLITGLGVDKEEAEGGEVVLSYDGLSSVHVWKFESSLTIQDELTSWNVQVHRWVKHYVYKPARRAGTTAGPARLLSLLFLYLWHGIYFGFANLFLVEALGVSAEEAICRYLSRERIYRALPVLPRWVVVAWQYVVKNACIGYGLCGFALRSWERCHVFYSSVYYCFHWGLAVLLLLELTVVRRVLRGRGAGAPKTD